VRCVSFYIVDQLFKVLGFVRSYPSYAYHVIERYTHVHTTYTTRHIHTLTIRTPNACTPYTTRHTHAIHTVHQRLHTHRTPSPTHATPTTHVRHSLPIGHAIA